MLGVNDELADLERRLDELDRAMTRAERALACPGNMPAETEALQRSLATLRSAFSELVRESLDAMRARSPLAFNSGPDARRRNQKQQRPAAKRH
jgi:hypothetical protein